MRRIVPIALLLVSLGLAAAAVPAVAESGPNHGPAATGGEAVVVDVELSGTTATGLSVGNATRVRQQVAADLGVAVDRVVVRSQDGAAAVEVQTAGVAPAELADALAAANVSVDRSSVRRGLTATSQQRAAAVVDGRLRAVQGYDGSVVGVAPQRLTVRVTPDPPQAVLDRLTQRGEVTVYARTPDRRAVLLTNRDVRRVQSARIGQNVSLVPVQLTPDGVERFTETFRRLNLTAEGVDACDGSPAPNATGYCMATSLNGEVVATAGVAEGLARAVESGVFTKNQWLGIVTDTAGNARAVRLAALSVPVPAETSVASVRNASVDATQTPSAGGGETTAPGANGPGFTPAVAVLALVAAVVVATRRD